MACHFVSCRISFAAALLAFGFLGCGAAGSAMRQDAETSLRLGRYCPADSVGYVGLNQARYRASVHGDIAQRILRGLINRTDTSIRRDAVFSALSELDEVFLPLKGGTATAPLGWNRSIVLTGADLARVVTWFELISERPPTRTTGNVAGHSAYIVGDAAVLETAPGEALVGSRTTLEHVLAEPAPVVHSFQTQNFRDVVASQIQPSVFEAVVALDGGELGPLGTIQGVVGMSVGLDHDMDIRMQGRLRSEEAAAAVLGRFETFRQGLASNPYTAIFGAQPVLDRIEVSQDGPSFRIHAHVEEVELHRMLTQFEAFIQMADHGDDLPEQDQHGEPEFF